MQDFLFYLKLGWEHIISLDALDHQLFVLALIVTYSLKDWKKVLVLVTAFTIGHSITLALSILNIVKIPSNWIEFLIPLTIFFTSLETIIFNQKTNTFNNKFNYILALLFGLIHGLGFANTARIMIAKNESIAVPLLGFNIGLELGQILIVTIILLISFVILHLFKLNKKIWILIISVIVLVLSFKMCIERLPFSL